MRSIPQQPREEEEREDSPSLTPNTATTTAKWVSEEFEEPPAQGAAYKFI